MNKKRYFGLTSIIAFCLLLLLISGCTSSGNKESDTAAAVPRVSETTCVTCHSASLERLTGYPIVTRYTTSVHNLNSVGCQDCHGAGGSHNGIGPIPYPSPNYVQCAGCHNNGTATNYALVTAYSTSKHLGVQLEPDAPCNRCHTHQGAVLSAISHFTGDGTVMAAEVGAPGTIPSPEPIKCNTCHETHDASMLRVDTAWGPSRFVIPLMSNSISNSTTTATLTSYGHGFANGASVTVSGAVPAAYNGTFVINTVTAHTFKYTMLSDPGGSATTQGVIRTSAVASTNDQYRLCTQCHGYINPAGLLMGSGTVSSGTALVGHHETSWYRIIGTTHYDNPATSAIEGYGMRFILRDGSVNPNPCFDCHGHEAKTNTGNLTRNGSGQYVLDATVVPTIYTDWGQSGHARGLLTAKYAAQDAYPKKGDGSYDRSVGMTDAVMAASVTGGAFAGHNTGSCARCHSTEGFSYYFENLADIPSPGAMAGVLKCYGCHSNPGAGTLRTLKGAKATTNYTTDLGWITPGYTLNYGKKTYPDVAASNICIACHDSRERDPGAIRDSSTNYLRTHYLQGATTMYVKMGFITFAPGAIPDNLSGVTIDTSLLSDQDGGTITSTHRKLGTPAMHGDSHNPSFFVPGNLDSKGPCVTCHFTGSHSQKIDQKAIDAVCSKCHTSEMGHSIATKAAFDTYFLEPQSEAYQAALSLAMTVFNNKATGIAFAGEAAPGVAMSEFVRPYVTSALPTLTEAAAANFTTALTVLGAPYNRTRVLGAVSNIVYLKREPGAFAHARTYSRRLLYDTIDYLDDGIMNKSVGATALALSVAPVQVSSSITRVGTLATLTAVGHGFVNGNLVRVYGAVPAGYNGTFTISGVTANTFQYTMSADPGSDAGTQGNFSNPVSGLFGKGATAFTDSSLTALAPGTTEAMVYLIAWTRGTGAWNSNERP